MLSKIQDFKQKSCSEKGWIKEQNISKVQEEGMRKVTERIRNKDIVVFTSDKSSKHTVDTVDNYNAALNDHTKDDLIIGREQVKKIERQMNQQLGHFNKMFRVGET